MKKSNPIYQALGASLVILFILTGTGNAASDKKTTKTISVLPFEIHASEDLTHVKNGIIHMLYSRLSWKDNVIVTPGRQIDKQLAALDNISDNKKISEIADQTQSDFIVTGSITKLAGSFSIDAKVFDIQNKRYMAFFEQSKKNNDLIDKVDRIAATINKKVLNRTTIAWEKMEKEKQAYINEMKRKNPEYMMRNPVWQDNEDAVGWKIWKYLF